MNLVKLILGKGCIKPLDYSSWNADNCGIRRHLLKYNRARANLAVVTYFEGTKNLGTRAYHYVVTYGWMTLAVLLARTAKCNSLVKSNIVADNGSLTNYNTGSMVNEEALTNLCTGVNLYSRLPYRSL